MTETLTEEMFSGFMKTYSRYGTGERKVLIVSRLHKHIINDYDDPCKWYPRYILWRTRLKRVWRDKSLRHLRRRFDSVHVGNLHPDGLRGHFGLIVTQYKKADDR